jgi:ubiquinone/menaquinone biosynthesis C-methylase UbiE
MEPGKIKRIKDEFGLASEAQAVAGYALLNQDFMYANYPLIADALIERLKLKDSVILDVGTGTGSLAIEFAKRLPDAKIFGLDISEEMISAAKKRVQENKLNNIEFLVCDVAKMDLQGLKFDLVTSFGVLHHLPDLGTLFNQIKKVLKSGAVAYIYDLRQGAAQDTINEIASAMTDIQKKAFLESVKEALIPDSLQALIRPCGFSEYKLTTPSFNRKTIVKNLALLRANRFSGEKFSRILLECFLKK